jgi:peroxiredoxin family protein
MGVNSGLPELDHPECGACDGAGDESVATSLMKQTIANNGLATIPDLLELCLEAGVKMIACQMTVELFGFDHSDFVDDIEYGGAATFFEFAGETDICLFI